MTIDKALKKSIEGGWKGLFNKEDCCEILLDPEFWQCLGMAMGWENKPLPNRRKIVGCQWLSYWHSFIDYLAEGKSIEQFFKNLK